MDKPIHITMIHFFVAKIETKIVDRIPKVSPIANHGWKNAPACGMLAAFAARVAHGPNRVAMHA